MWLSNVILAYKRLLEYLLCVITDDAPVMIPTVAAFSNILKYDRNSISYLLLQVLP